MRNHELPQGWYGEPLTAKLQPIEEISSEVIDHREALPKTAEADGVKKKPLHLQSALIEAFGLDKPDEIDGKIKIGTRT